MTTALAIYVPPSEDAGRGLVFRRGWLVSTASARHGRWLALWCQEALCWTWTVGVVLLRALWRFNRRDPRYLASVAAGAAVWWSALHLDPLAWPFLGAMAGIGLGFMWVIGPLYSAGNPS